MVYAMNSAATDLYLGHMAKVLTRYGFEGRNVTVQLRGRSYELYLWNLVRNAMKGPRHPDRRARRVRPFSSRGRS